MKICLVCPYSLSFPGGVQEHVKALYQQFKKMGHQVKIITPSAHWGEKPQNQDIIFVGRSRKINIDGTRAPITFGLNYSLKLRKILKKENFDLIHLHTPWIPTLSWFVMYHAKVPMVATFHCAREKIPKKQSFILAPLRKLIVLPLVKRLAGRIAVSQAAKSWIWRYLKGSYQIIPNGVDTKRFHPQASPLEKFKDGKINLLYVGRLEERKGLLYLLKAYQKIQNGTRLIIVGDGPLKKPAQKLVKNFQLKEIHFEGRVSPEILPSYYTTADIFCSPATHGESFGIVLLEAMASGLPVVASKIPGYQEVLTKKEGILVPPKNPEKLAQALGSLIKNQSLRQKLAKAGLLRAKKYDWKIIAGEILAFYRKILRYNREERRW